jgi:hypothetical protein
MKEKLKKISKYSISVILLATYLVVFLIQYIFVFSPKSVILGTSFDNKSELIVRENIKLVESGNWGSNFMLKQNPMLYYQSHINETKTYNDEYDVGREFLQKDNNSYYYKVKIFYTDSSSKYEMFNLTVLPCSSTLGTDKAVYFPFFGISLNYSTDNENRFLLMDTEFGSNFFNDYKEFFSFFTSSVNDGILEAGESSVRLYIYDRSTRSIDSHVCLHMWCDNGSEILYKAETYGN